eukprot:198153_1
MDSFKTNMIRLFTHFILAHYILMTDGAQHVHSLSDNTNIDIITNEIDYYALALREIYYLANNNKKPNLERLGYAYGYEFVDYGIRHHKDAGKLSSEFYSWDARTPQEHKDETVSWAMFHSANIKEILVVFLGTQDTWRLDTQKIIQNSGKTTYPCRKPEQTFDIEFHSGILSMFEDSAPQLVHSITAIPRGSYERITFVGHSLGGGLAVMHALDLWCKSQIMIPIRVLTFGSLRYITAESKSRFPSQHVQVVNIINDKDDVPTRYIPKVYQLAGCGPRTFPCAPDPEKAPAKGWRVLTQMAYQAALGVCHSMDDYFHTVKEWESDPENHRRIKQEIGRCFNSEFTIEH